MPEKIVISLKKIDLQNIPTWRDVATWVKSMNFDKYEYKKLCHDKRFLRIMEQPLKVTMELAIEILGLENKREANPS